MAAKPSQKPARRPITREEMLAPRQRQTEVDVSAFFGDGAVFVMRGLSIREAAEVKEAATDPQTEERDGDLYKVLLIAKCSVDPELSPVDVQGLLDQNTVVVNSLYEAALNSIAFAADVETATATFLAGRDG